MVDLETWRRWPRDVELLTQGCGDVVELQVSLGFFFVCLIDFGFSR